MTDGKRRTLYRILLGSAGIFYVWGLGALWFSHEWNIPESTFFFVGILPVVTGVVLMVWAIRLHVELIEEDDEPNGAPNPSADASSSGGPSPRS